MQKEDTALLFIPPTPPPRKRPKLDQAQENHEKEEEEEGKTEKKKLVILDIDGTLVGSVSAWSDGADFSFDYREGVLKLMCRPGMREFLQKCVDREWSLALWTFGQQFYADFIAKEVCQGFNFVFVLGANAGPLARQTPNHAKDVKQLCLDRGLDPSDVLLIDDDLINCEFNAELAISIQSYVPSLNLKDRREPEFSIGEFDRVFGEIETRWCSSSSSSSSS